MVLSEELVMSFLVPVTDSLHWLFPLEELVASSIQDTVLVLGRPGDILQAATGGMSCYRQPASMDGCRLTGGVDARAGTCQQASRSLRSCPLHFLDWHKIASCLLCSLLFPLSGTLK